jgi:hypothetical protein
MFDDLTKEDKSNRYLIKVFTKHGEFFIDNVVLEGNEEELYFKMKSLDYVKSLGIDESFLYEPFELVREDSVLFPK